VLEHSGFSGVRWGKQTDVFSGSKHESDAAEFDTRGVTFAARKGLGSAGSEHAPSERNGFMN